MSADEKSLVERCVIEIDKLDKVLLSDMKSAFEKLKSDGYVIAPWIESEFWKNMDLNDFAGMFMHDLLRAIEKYSPKNPEKAGMDPKIASLLYAALHIFISRRTSFDSNELSSITQSITKKSKGEMKEIMCFVIPWIDKHREPVGEWIDTIMKTDFASSILQKAVPFFSLFSFARDVKMDKFTKMGVYKALKRALMKENTRDQNIILLHLTNMVCELFPDAAAEDKVGELPRFKEALLSMLGRPAPISTEATILGNRIEKETKWNGRGYCKMMRHICDLSVATDGVVQLLFDPDVRLFPSYMYTTSSVKYCIKNSLIAWSKYFLASKLKCSPHWTDQGYMEFAMTIQFNDDKFSKMQKTFRLQPSPEPVKAECPKPPIIKIAPNKLPVSMELMKPPNVDGVSELIYVNGPGGNIFKNIVLKPIMAHLKGFRADLLQHSLVLAGDDFFIGNMLNIINWANSEAKELNNVVFNFYVLPIGRQNNYLADYIASRDPIYNMTVRHVYECVTSIAPVFDESGTAKASFVNVLNKDLAFDENVWLANPTPSTMLQFALQHYLIFARNTLNVRVWKATLTRGDEKIMVPFIIELHIGNMFMPAAAKATNKKMKMSIQSASYMTQKTDAEKVIIYSAVLWNLHKDFHKNPDDPFLLQELNTTPVDCAADRTRDAASVTQKSVFMWKASIDPEDPNASFNVTIDGRLYKNVTAVSVTKMKSTLDPTDQMRFRVATFTDNFNRA